MNGSDTSIIGPVDLTPGISALASCGTGPGEQLGTAGPEHKAAFSALKAGVAADSVLGSSATACESATLWLANAPAVVLKSLIRFSSVWGWVSIAAATGPCSAIQFDRSLG